MSNRSFRILVVEDNPADLKLIEEMIAGFDCICRIFVAMDGDEAIRLLQRGDFAGATRPDLVILDLNLPKKDGHEVLQEIRGHRLTQTTPVIIFSSSENDRDILRAYDASCNCYIKKPFTLEEFERAVRGIEAYWLQLARLPE